MEFTKSHWQADDNRVSLSVPIAKVNQELRQVSGFATLDNVDTGDDVVMAVASKAAFETFRGNIREMHEPIAAGRLVDFKEETFFHNGQVHNGIYVTAYVSKGAESTWEKVIDGTLSGFSIGGRILEQETQYVADLGKSVRFITKYELIELSLVDNPANQLANVFSIQKSADGESFMKGMVAETHIVNVFWCPKDEIAKNSENESEVCLSCGAGMQQIGWFERGDDNVSKMQNIVSKFLRQKEGNDETEPNVGEGGVNMPEQNENTEGAAEDVVTTENVETPEEKTEENTAEEVSEVTEEEPAEEAAETSEVEEEADFEKMFNELRDSINKSLGESKDAVDEAVKSVDAKIDELSKSFDEKISAVDKKASELDEKLETYKSQTAEITKSLEAIEKSTAIKKSGEVGGDQPVQKSQKGFWGDAFFSDGNE